MDENKSEETGNGAERDGITPEPPRSARLMAVIHKRLGTTLFFVLLGVYSLAGTVILTDSALLTALGLFGFATSIIARYFLHDQDSRKIRMLKCFGDIAAVILIAATMRDAFQAHPVIKWICYLLTFIFCLMAAKVFDRDVFETPVNEDNQA